MNLFLLIFRISLDFSLDTGHKNADFSKILSKKGFKFVLNREDNIIIFNLGLMLLLAKLDLILKEQGYKKDVLRICNTGHIKISFVLLTEVIALYIGVTIVQVEVSSLDGLISEYKICFTIF